MTHLRMNSVKVAEDCWLVTEIDDRCKEILNKLNTGKFNLTEAVDEVKKQLEIEDTEPMRNLLWELGGAEQRMIEKQEKEKFLASLSEEDRKRYIERGGCVIPCKECDSNSRYAPCYDP